MTTPGGVPNLPQGALTLDTLSSDLEDMSGAAMKDRAVARFPSIFDLSTGLSPAIELTPFGILTRIFAEANSVIATADPADIQGPDDIPDLLLEFITGLPVIGQFIEILQAILGEYEGDDETLLGIQAIFAPIRALLSLVAGGTSGGGFPSLEELTTGWAEGLGLTGTKLNQIIEVIQGLTIVPIDDGISAFQAWVTGLGDRFLGNESNHQSLLDAIVGGFRQESTSGSGPGDAGTAAGDTSVRSSTAMALSEWVNAIQSLRNNTDLFEGVDETEEANFKLDKVWNNTGAEPAAVYSATSAAVPVAYKNFAAEAKKGFISFFAKTSDATNVVIDVYQANPDTSMWDGPIYTSPNLMSQIDTTWRYIVHNISDVEDRIDVSSGVKLGIAYRVIGAGTLSVAGEPYNQPAHPSIHPKRPVSVRTGSGAISFASTDYSPTVVPWFGIGIIAGDVPPPFLAPVRVSYSTPGAGTYTIPEAFRVAGNLIDCVGCGAGSGAYGSLGWLPTPGGTPGSWNGITLVYGTDIPLGTATLDYFVPSGGRGGDGTVGGAPDPGAAATVSRLGVTLVTAPGGTWTSPGGQSGPGDYDYAGRHFTGGNNNGQSPGAGGAGALPYLGGGTGGNGMVGFTARQP